MSNEEGVELAIAAIPSVVGTLRSIMESSGEETHVRLSACQMLIGLAQTPKEAGIGSVSSGTGQDFAAAQLAQMATNKE